MKGTANTSTAGRFAGGRRGPLDHDEVLRLRACGVSVQNIAQMTGSCMEDVRKVIADANGKADRRDSFIDALPADNANDHRATWTRADVGRLVQLYFVEDRSASETAQIMDRSLNSIIGKATRLGLLKGKPGRKAA